MKTTNKILLNYSLTFCNTLAHIGDKFRVNFKFIFCGALFLATVTLQGCKKYIQADAPYTSTNAGNVYTNDATAAATLTGIYAQISNLNADLGADNLTSLSLYPALSADELTLYNRSDSRYFSFYSDNLTNLTSSGLFWNNLYSIIFIVNSSIEGLSKSLSLTPAVKQQLLGESKFIRAFCYFYLINLYGDVPLALSSDYKVNSTLSRTPSDKVYAQIVQDLKDAQNLLSPTYVQSDAVTSYASGTEQRVRPTKWAATALLARVYLYTGNYSEAENQASAVVSNPYYKLDELDEVFQMNSDETIWSLQPVGTGPQSNTGEGALFILPFTGPNDYPNVVYLSNSLLNSFEIDDQRKTDWIGSASDGTTTYYFPYKYKVGLVDQPTSEYIMVLRLAEIYLIRAEARAQQENLAGAQADLNMIRNRAGLPNTTANDKSSLLSAILHERQVELFTEWGHRWFDLKRTHTIDAVMTTVAAAKGSTWSTNKALYPIPQADINTDHNLIQNPGY